MAWPRDGIGTQVHYIPVHRQPYYAQRYGAHSLPGAERYYASTLTLPLHPAMSEADVVRVVAALKKQILGLQKKPPARSDVANRATSLLKQVAETGSDFLVEEHAFHLGEMFAQLQTAVRTAIAAGLRRSRDPPNDR